MNHLILNRDFRLPDNGWYHIAPLGEFAHAGACVTQVIDQEACIAMAARFAADANTPNFPGLLIDFDHFSLDGEKHSEAAGWIITLEARLSSRQSAVDSGQKGEGNPHPGPLPSQGEGVNGGLWAQIRWSDLGEEAVKGGRYRFLSPVWARSDCVDLGNGRVRPVRILNAAVTNDPNLKGMVPLSNRAESESVDFRTIGERAQQKGSDMKAVIEKLVNHLGLAADATEALILEKLGELLTVTAATELQNSLSALQGKYDGLIVNLKAVEGELVNRHLADFEGIVTEKTKGFWTEQLVANRQGTLTALAELATQRDTASGKQHETGTESPTRKPLHNRATARPLLRQGYAGQADAASTETDSKAVKIRNRAHEIAAVEKIPFGVAFRRAEREVLGGGQ